MEVEETLQAIEDQQEYERQSYIERVEWDAGITIRNREEILELLICNETFYIFLTKFLC